MVGIRNLIRALVAPFFFAMSLMSGLQAMDSGTCANDPARHNTAIADIRQHNDEAIELLESCVGLSKTIGEHAASLAAYGIALHSAARNTEARRALEQALAESDNIPGQRIRGRAVTIDALASVDRSLGDYQGAERVLRDAIADPASTQDERSIPMVSLSSLLREELRISEAKEILDDASRLSGLSWQRHIELLVETAELDREMHLWDASIASWNEAGGIAISQHSSLYDAVIAGGLGDTWLWAGNPARAEPLLRRSLQLLREDPGATMDQVATSLAVLAELYEDEDKLALAADAVDEAIAKEESSLGPGHPRLASLLELRACILSRRDENQEARDDLERARLIMSGYFGSDSTAVAVVYTALGDVELHAHQPAAAAQQYGLAMRRFLQAGAEGIRYGATILARYASALKAAHRPDEARALLKTFRASEMRVASKTSRGK